MANYSQVLEAVSRLADELLERSAVKLPPERELALRLGASRATVRRALGTLEERGVVRRVKGRAGGAYLRGIPLPPSPRLAVGPTKGRKLERSLDRVIGVPAMLRSQGFAVGTTVLALTLDEAPAEVGESLRLADGTSVVSLLRLRYADGDTLSLEQAYLDADRFAGLLRCDLTASLYELLLTEFGCQVDSAEEWLEAIAAPSHVAGLLGLEPGAPLVKLIRQSYDSDGRPVEFSYDLFRADRTRFCVTERGN